MTTVVFGGSGIVGGFIAQKLPGSVVISRRPNPEWVMGDLNAPDLIRLPPAETIYCTANAILLADALPSLITPGLRRVVAFTTTSILTKEQSGDRNERDLMARFRDAEARIAAVCEKARVEWTILRPTLVYCEGRDRNITRISRLIDRIGFFPICGDGAGLRQPVHAEDLALGAIAAAASPKAANRVYALPGGETIPYREMIGRLFDGLNRTRRLVHVPPPLWRGAFTLAKPLYPGFNASMGDRMSRDMTFDSLPAVRDFGWSARNFRPVFQSR